MDLNTTKKIKKQIKTADRRNMKVSAEEQGLVGVYMDANSDKENGDEAEVDDGVD